MGGTAKDIAQYVCHPPTLSFYLNLVNKVYGRPIKTEDLPTEHPRIIKRLKEYFKDHPLPNNDKFSHLKPAIYLKDNSAAITIPKNVLERFQKLFDTLNKLVIK